MRAMHPTTPHPMLCTMPAPPAFGAAGAGAGPLRRGRGRGRGRTLHTVSVAAPVTATALARQRDLAKFFAGGLAGSLSAVLTTPLEVLRTRIQASGAGRRGRGVVEVARAVMASGGVRAFYAGLGSSIVGSLPARSIYFSAYAACKGKLTDVFGGDGPLVHLLSAVAAGASSNFVMSPLWVVRTRLQLNTTMYRGYAHAVERILRDEGIRGLYRGFSASLWGCSEGAIQFVLYERLKKLQRMRAARAIGVEGQAAEDTIELSPMQYTATAAVSKLVASVATYPHERVRVLMREVPKLGANPKYRGMVQSLRLVAKEEGWKGLYRGMGMHLSRSVPNAALMFLTYEVVSKNIERRHARKMAELHSPKAASGPSPR